MATGKTPCFERVVFEFPEAKAQVLAARAACNSALYYTTHVHTCKVFYRLSREFADAYVHHTRATAVLQDLSNHAITNADDYGRFVYANAMYIDQAAYLLKLANQLLFYAGLLVLAAHGHLGTDFHVQ